MGCVFFSGHCSAALRVGARSRNPHFAPTAVTPSQCPGRRWSLDSNPIPDDVVRTSGVLGDSIATRSGRCGSHSSWGRNDWLDPLCQILPRSVALLRFAPAWTPPTLVGGEYDSALERDASLPPYSSSGRSAAGESKTGGPLVVQNHRFLRRKVGGGGKRGQSASSSRLD